MQDIQSSLGQFFLKGKAYHYNKNAVLIESESPTADIYYLEKGHVRVYALTPNGTQKIYVFYKPGEMFPVIWAFNHIKKHLFYEAMEDVVIRKIPTGTFMEFIKDKPNTLLELIHYIININSVYVDRIDNLEYSSAYARLISRLLFMANRFGIQQDTSIILNIPVTHQDIASTITMTRETTSRELEKLEKKGLITKKNHFFIIPNRKRLEEELEMSAERNLL